MRRFVPLAVAGAIAAPLTVTGLALAERPVDGAGTSAGRRSGLHGIVYRGPVMPVCRPDIPCEVPAAGIRLTFTRRSAAPVRTRTAADGSYLVLLPASVYEVTVGDHPRIGKMPAPRRVKVRAGHVDRLDLHIDTGIR
jgi:hypothetical protein